MTATQDTQNTTDNATGYLFILVGPSGAGKNTIAEEMRRLHPDLIQLPTMTTRPPRAGEIEGVHHYFVTIEQFRELVASGALLEHQEVHPGKWYGVPRQQTSHALATGKLMVADVDIAGALDVKRAFPDSVTTIFIQPPTLDSLHDRIIARDGERISADELHARLAKAKVEMERADECDYIVVNAVINESLAEVQAIFEQVLIARRPTV